MGVHDQKLYLTHTHTHTHTQIPLDNQHWQYVGREIEIRYVKYKVRNCSNFLFIEVQLIYNTVLVSSVQ